MIKTPSYKDLWNAAIEDAVETAKEVSKAFALRDATIATLTAALEEARGALGAFAAAYERHKKASKDNKRMWAGASFADFDRAVVTLATINAALGRVEG